MRGNHFLLFAIICMFAGGVIALGQCVPPPSGMVAWWPGDNSTTDIVNGNNGTLMSGATYTAGNVLQAFDFGNGSGYLTVPSSSTLNFGTGDFSMDAWVRLPAGSSTRTIVDKRNTTPVGYNFYIYSGLPGVQIADGSSTNYNANSADHPSIADNTWHHVAVTVQRSDSNGIRFYVDGVQLATNRDPRAHQGSLTNTANLRLGRNVFDLLPLSGRLDEVELFSRVLTPAEILSIFQAGSFGKCKTGSPPNENHYKTWRIAPLQFSWFVKVQDQFMTDSLHLIGIEFLSNPVKKIHQPDTFNIIKPYDYLTWYRALGKDTLLTVGYINQFESTAVSIDSVKYLLVPTQKEPYAPPESLDHYKAYQIKNPMTLHNPITLKDEFDVMYGQSEFIDSLIPRYFLTPALKNIPPPMFDSVTHYVAYEIFPKRVYPLSDTTHDQFNEHFLQVLNSEFLLVPSTKFIPPDTSGSICGSKFNDLDCDGTWDLGEPGLAGWTINLAGPVVSSVITGVGGAYCFSGLAPGNYTVSEVIPPGGWTQTKPPLPGTYAVPLLSGQSVIGIDFGNCFTPQPSDTGRNHYKTWRIAPLQFNTFVRVHDQFMTDSLHLIGIEFLSNPVKKIHQLDTFNILKPNDHLTWYRALGKDTLLTITYVNQFESTAVSIDSVKYLLVPTQKEQHAPPESLDHYKAYRIKNPMTLHNLITLEDQFDTLGHPVSIDSLKPTYFLTPALKNIPPPMFDSVTHYVAYEIFPKRFSPRQVNTSDQFGPHIMQVQNSEFLLVPSAKSIPPDTSGSICGSKFNDLDCDGVWDVGEPGMAGWTINLTGTAIKSTVTGADGSYCFNGLSPGNYTVSEVIPPGGWTQTLPLPPGTYIINLSSGETVTGKDFGNGICPPVQSDTSRNHYKTWRIAPLQFNTFVRVHDQFMTDSLHLIGIEFLSNPVKKIHQLDTFNILKPNDHLTWYRALGKDTLLTITYVNQFESTAVSIDSVKYLLVPTQKEQHAPPESLDHYKAYRIKNPMTLHNLITLEDQFDTLGHPVSIDSLKPTYFLTPALKNIPPPMFDSVTHYVAYEIFPKRFSPRQVNTSDQFGPHIMQVQNSEFLLVPSTKFIPTPPDTGTAYNKDFQNNTGQTVNNIEIILEGDQYIYQTYDNNGGGTHGYTDGIFRFSSTVTTMGGNIVTVLKWDNVNVPPGGIVHIGFWTHNTSVTIKSMYWTKDSICIGPITQVTLNPTWIVSSGVIIKNNVTGCPPVAVAVPLNAQVIAVEYYEKAQPLGNLNNYTNRTPIRRDTAGFVPITLPADASDTVYCVDPPSDANYMVWIIDIDPDPGMASPALTRDFVQFPIGRTLDGTVNGGWDMVSVPLYADDMRKTILFPTATSDAFTYEGYYAIYDTLIPNKGYWLKFPSAQTVTMSGYELTSGAVTVTSGWNMIGTLSIPIPVSLITSEPPGLVTSDFFGFNGSYHQEDTIMPFKGYWIKSSGPGTLILSTTQSAEVIAKNAIRIVSISELPPPPPDVSAAVERTIPKEYRLDQAYPNPFNPVTTIRYELPVDSRVSLKVYDILGQVVAILKEGTEQAGYKSVEWNAGIVSSGIYFYKLEAVNVSDVAKSYTQVKKVLLLK